MGNRGPLLPISNPKDMIINKPLSPEVIKLIKLDEKKALLYHIDTMQIYEIDDGNIISFLSDYKIYNSKEMINRYGKSLYYKYIKNINKLIDKSPGIICFDISQYDVLNGYFDTIVLPISGHCTLKCPYCFAQTDGHFNFNDYSTKDIENTLKFSFENRAKYNYKTPFWIVFFGGEPLMRVDLIKYTIEYIKTYYPNEKINYSITTNGTILSDEIISIFKENNFKVLVSIDGPDNEYNLRKDLQGNKSIDKVIKFIETLKDNNIYTELRATIVNTNPYIVKTFDFLESFQLPFFISFAYSSENKGHNLSIYDNDILRSIQMQLEHLLKYYTDKMLKHQPIFNKKFYQTNMVLRFRENKRLPCAAGRTYFTITASGDIFSCAHFMNNKKHAIGHISNKNIHAESYRSINIETIEECSKCWAKYICLGHCPAQKISSGKKNNSAATVESCELEKILLELYIKLYYYSKTIAKSVYEESLESIKKRLNNDDC